MDVNDDLTTLDLDLSDPLDALEPVADAAPPVDPDAMLPLLSSPDSQQRMLAARAFCEVEDPRAVDPLVALLADRCPLTRVSAAYALGRNPHPTAVEPLMKLLATDWNGYVRKGVVWALGNARDARTLPPLIDALKTDIAAVRLWAASALAQAAGLGYEAVIAALPPLIQTMRRDSEPAIRSNCAWAVGQLCRELPSNVVYHTAVDALLETFAEDQDLGVREDARTAILKVGDARGLQTIEELEQDGWF